ncbi:MAG: NUDIX domain-containing protein [Hydrogenophaga sp.]|nr:NUDIX domain-containing protein [Hydrogenophaga sp.]
MPAPTPAAPEGFPTPETVSTLVVDADQARAPEEGDRTVVDVAVGILVASDGAFLLTTRPPGKAYAGYWEFPGGKLKEGESVEMALRRELQEEIGVTIGPVLAWKEQVVDYPHALVRLHFCKVFEWTGELHMHEGQDFQWQHLPVNCTPVLPGTVPVLGWLEAERAG